MESKKKPLAASIVLFLTLWLRFSDAHESDKCGEVSSIMRSCLGALQGGEEASMRAESVCCRSLKAVEGMMEDGKVGRFEICECMKAVGGDYQALINENLLEVHALCGPRLPYPITPQSDCAMMSSGVL